MCTGRTRGNRERSPRNRVWGFSQLIAFFSAIISLLERCKAFCCLRPTLKCILVGIDDMPQPLLEDVAVSLWQYSVYQQVRYLTPRCYDLSVVAVGTADEIDHGTDVVIACAPQVTSSREPPPISVACILSVGPSTCGSLSVVTDGHDHVRLLDLTTRDTLAFVLQRCDAAQKVRADAGKMSFLSKMCFLLHACVCLICVATPLKMFASIVRVRTRSTWFKRKNICLEQPAKEIFT